MERRFLTTREASAYLDNSGLTATPATLNTWRCIGKGPQYLKFGERVRYRPEDLDAWLESKGQLMQTAEARAL